MKFEIDKEIIMDTIAIYGKDHAISIIMDTFRATLDVAIEELEQDYRSRYRSKGD